jgi:hypothetical protein
MQFVVQIGVKPIPSVFQTDASIELASAPSRCCDRDQYRRPLATLTNWGLCNTWKTVSGSNRCNEFCRLAPKSPRPTVYKSISKARVKRLELLIYGFGDRCFSQLSYTHVLRRINTVFSAFIQRTLKRAGASLPPLLAPNRPYPGRINIRRVDRDRTDIHLFPKQGAYR